LHFFEKGLENPEDDDIRANYNWMLLEMYDQTVRNNSGGEMAKYIYQDEIINENFIYQRIGEEGRGLRNNYLRSKNDVPLKTQSSVKTIKSYLRKIKDALKSLNKPNTYESIGRFRLEGEIHQWMYDRYSLSYILKTLGFNDVQVRDAFSSYINNWSEYELDGKKGIVRKPDSLFIEAIKI
jgi:hypothetical protein